MKNVTLAYSVEHEDEVGVANCVFLVVFFVCVAVLFFFLRFIFLYESCALNLSPLCPGVGGSAGRIIDAVVLRRILGDEDW